MDIIIREYEEKDLFQVSKLLQDVFSVKKDGNFKLDQYVELVAEVDDTVVGYLLVTKILNPVENSKYFLVDYVCVKEEYRGNNIGKKLLEKVEYIGKQEKIVYIQMTSSRFRVSAHKLYINMGYEIRESDIFRKVIV